MHVHVHVHFFSRVTWGGKKVRKVRKVRTLLHAQIVQNPPIFLIDFFPFAVLKWQAKPLKTGQNRPRIRTFLSVENTEFHRYFDPKNGKFFAYNRSFSPA